MGAPDASTGISWIDRTLNKLRDDLLESPSEEGWLALKVDILPLPDPGFWEEIRSAVRNPNKASIEAATASIRANIALSEAQKKNLCSFLAQRLLNRKSAAPLQVVQLSLQKLLDRPDAVDPEHAISVVCSGIFLLKILGQPVPRWVGTPDIVRDTFSLLSLDMPQQLIVPACLTQIDYEAFLTVLHQLRSTDCLDGALEVTTNSEQGLLHITGGFRADAARDHWPLLAETWGMCDLSRNGFSVSGSVESFDISVSLTSTVRVTPDGFHAECAAEPETPTALPPPVSTDVEAARSALHEIKNRMIASPAHWAMELGEASTNLMKVAQLLRTPEIQRIDLKQIRLFIEEAVTEANALNGTSGIADVIEDDGCGYVDADMLKTILKNLTDNAARSAGDVVNGTWAIEGYADAESLEITISNSCGNVHAARTSIESNTPGVSSIRGTGLGVSTIRRLAGKLMGKVTYEYEDSAVVSRLYLPVNLAALSW
jgi:hypothetical protein